MIKLGDSLVEKSRGNEESHRPAASHRQSLSHNVVSGTPCHEHGIELTTLVVLLGTIFICKSKTDDATKCKH
jgi:hypothetical protein